MTLVLKTLATCEPKIDRYEKNFRRKLNAQPKLWEQYQDKEAMARFRSSKNRDIVLVFGNEVLVYKRSTNVDKQGETTTTGKAYQPFGTPRLCTDIASKFLFPVLQKAQAQVSDTKAPESKAEKHSTKRAGGLDGTDRFVKTSSSLADDEANEREDNSKIDFYGHGLWNHKMKKLKAKLKRKALGIEEEEEDKDSTDDNDPEKHENSSSGTSSNEADESQIDAEKENIMKRGKKFRRRHHRRQCKLHKNNRMPKIAVGPNRGELFTFPKEELRSSDVRVARCSHGCTTVKDIEEFNICEWFPQLTVEKTHAQDAFLNVFITRSPSRGSNKNSDEGDDAGSDNGTPRKPSPVGSCEGVNSPQLMPASGTWGRIKSLLGKDGLAKSGQGRSSPFSPSGSMSALPKLQVSATSEGSPKWMEHIEDHKSSGEESCDCTEHSTTSSEGERCESPVEKWRWSLHERRCVLDDSLRVALTRRKKDRAEVYKDVEVLGRLNRRTEKVAARWEISKRDAPYTKHPKIRSKEIQEEFNKKLDESLATVRTQENNEEWTINSPPAVILRRPSPMCGKKLAPQLSQLLKTLDTSQRVTSSSAVLPLVDGDPTRPASLWCSIWSEANQKRRSHLRAIAVNAELYNQVAEAAVGLRVPYDKLQEQFCDGLRSFLMGGEAIDSDRIAHMIKGIGMEVLTNSRDFVKLVHFICSKLSIPIEDLALRLGWKNALDLLTLKKKAPGSTQ